MEWIGGNIEEQMTNPPVTCKPEKQSTNFLQVELRKQIKMQDKPHR
jgi:hypothetical protein